METVVEPSRDGARARKDRREAVLIAILIVGPFAVRPILAVTTLSIPGPTGFELLALFTLPLTGFMALVPGSRLLRRTWLGASVLAVVVFFASFLVVERAILLIPIYRGSAIIDAIEAFEQAHGEPPNALNELVPEFIDSIPTPGITNNSGGFVYHPPGWTVPPSQHDWYLKVRGRACILHYWSLTYRHDGQYTMTKVGDPAPSLLFGWKFYPGDWGI